MSGYIRANLLPRMHMLPLLIGKAQPVETKPINTPPVVFNGIDLAAPLNTIRGSFIVDRLQHM